MKQVKEYKDLKQLDRIEAILLEDKIERERVYYPMWKIWVPLFSAWALGLILFSIFFYSNYDLAIQILKITNVTIIVFGAFAIIVLLFNTLGFIKWYRDMSKLKEHFLVKEIKAKRKK